MSEAEKNYERKVLKNVIKKHLNKSISTSKESLNTLEDNLDEVVWDLAKKVFSESGHKVELSIVRDVVNSKIESMKYQLAEKYRLAVKKECTAGQVPIEHMPKHDRHIAEQKSRQIATEKSESEVFGRVKEIISEELSVDLDRVNLDSHLADDLGADGDSNEFLEIVMALEEEFDIEITDSEIEDELGILYSSTYSGSTSSSSGSFWSMLGSISAISSSAYSSYTSTGDKCIVQSFVDLVYKKLND